MVKRIVLANIFLLIFLFGSWQTKEVFSAKEHACDDPPLTAFSNGSTSITTIIPAGGGRVAAGKIKLLQESEVCQAQLTLDRAPSPVSETPYIWIPNSDDNTVAQIRTKDGTLVKLYGGYFSNPSRITVIQGGDVWIANRGNTQVIRLKPKSGSEEYEYGGSVDMGQSWIRAVTFDRNGYLWAGTCAGGGDRLRVFCAGDLTCGPDPIGTIRAELANGKCNYGMIGDRYGFVWSVGGSIVTSYSYSGGTISQVDQGNVGGSYGIGMDNDANIWIGRHGGGGVYKITRSPQGAILSISHYPSGLSSNTGVAVSGDNKVWAAGYGSGQVSVFKTDGAFIANYPVGAPHGVAIDSNDNAWVVNLGGGGPGFINPNPPGTCGGNGTVTVRRSDGSLIATYPTCGNGPYNYSDMTGFRTPMVTFEVGDVSVTPPSYPFTINDANVPGFSNALNNVFQTCSCQGCVISAESACGNLYCEVPITLSSVFAGGAYTLGDLSVHYGDPVSKVRGGLVPCGRNCDDTSTEIRENAPCTLCATFVLSKRVVDFTFAYIVIPLAILMFVIGGLLYALVGEDTQRINQAKSLLTTAVIGLAVIFSAWLLVNSILFFITEGKIPLPGEAGKVFNRPWNEIYCSFCGNGVCDSGKGENHTTCPYDCP